MTLEQFNQHYEVETRADYMYTHNKWMVLYNKDKHHYVTDGPKAHKRFTSFAEILEYVKQHMDDLAVQVNDQIMIIDMSGEPEYAGLIGTVTLIDDAGQIHGTWGGCALVPDADKYTII